MEGVKDVQGGAVRSSAPGLHGGRDEHAGGCPSVRSAPGYGAQDTGLLSPAGATGGRHLPEGPNWSPTPASSTASLKKTTRSPGSSAHTAKRIFERLRDEHGFGGQYTVVKDYVRERRRRTKEMFVPLSHAPGHAQCDFGEARVIIGGGGAEGPLLRPGPAPQRRLLHQEPTPRRPQRPSWTATSRRSPFWAGCPGAFLYDNTRLAVARILGDGRRKRTRAFTELQSHYLFEDRFGRPGKGNDKGEGGGHGWAMCGATSWCRCRPSRALRR